MSKLHKRLSAGSRRSPRTRSVMIATAMLVLGVTSFGVASTGDLLREGVRNGTSTKETEIVSNINSTKAKKGGYSTRQSNLSSSGGGAIYGCRSGAGGSGAASPMNPCLRANNLAGGLAFEFNASKGTTAGTINVGAGGDTTKPFTTNATGVATGLNADRLDGADAADIVAASRNKPGLDADTVDGQDSVQLKTRWALVDERGVIVEQSGGFTVTSAYAGANDNVFLDTGASLEGHGITATISAQNQVNQAGGPAAEPNFGGEISVARCAQPNVVVCGPAGTNTNTQVLVAPRDSDGTPTTNNTRKRFYVVITE